MTNNFFKKIEMKYIFFQWEVIALIFFVTFLIFLGQMVTTVSLIDREVVRIHNSCALEWAENSNLLDVNCNGTLVKRMDEAHSLYYVRNEINFVNCTEYKPVVYEDIAYECEET
jgi:hypothetical protein